MGTKVNLYKQSGTDDGTSVNFNLPRSLTYGLNARANDDGGVTESDNCEYNTLNGLSTLLKSSSLIITPNSYKEGKLYSVIPSDGSGDMSVTRATTATRVNSAGLVELVPYNLVKYSQDFSNAIWAKTISSITYNQPDPFGGNNAALCTFTNVSTSRIDQNLSIIAGNTYTISAWIKGVDITDFRFIFGSSQAVFVTSQIVNGEWVRVSATVTATTTGTYAQAIARTANTNGESFYIYGAQLVEGTNALPYQKTETRLNIPRLDYSLGSCPSLLVEPQRTNQYTKSEDFNGWSSKTLVTTTADYSISPSGILNADRLQFTGSGFLHNAIAQVSATQYTVSCYAKRNDSGTQSVGFFVNGTGTVDSAWSLTNEWQRFTYTYTASNNSQNGIAGLSGADVSVFGFQREAGAYPTSYIPTTSASVTRNADAISKTGISSLIGQTEGTIYLEADIQKHNESEFYVAISNGSSLGEAIYLYQPSGGILQVLFRTGGVNETISILNANWNIGYNKIAIAYNSTSGEVFMNGVSQGTVALSALPTCSQLTLGARPDIPGNLVGSGGYKSTAIFKTRLTNAQLASLTSL
jgi:hypothetical protein